MSGVPEDMFVLAGQVSIVVVSCSFRLYLRHLLCYVFEFCAHVDCTHISLSFVGCN